MKNICNIIECTGCMACANVCAHHAIYIKKDEEGFDRPVIDKSLCVDCGLCVKTCPINHHPDAHEPVKIYSGWSSEEDVRTSSSSGGAFTEIARPVLEEGGVVFGCALNDKLQAEHIYVETLEDLKYKLSGSKYVQSRIGNSYTLAKGFLRQGRKVLFSGTPCQIAGLKNYLRRDYDNLITVDLICHGVPSPMLFEDYKTFMQKHENMKLTKVSFRCKKSSWIFYNMTLKGHVEKSSALKTYVGSYYEDPYIRASQRDYFLRPSCHQCKFTTT
ncbi:Coenzyme F420 hydrogenase/dehydrogenase, beta subunit C-terminal domain, partial [Prevotella sp.]|uniref:Coenzyme F420 hydrogenase/dehydrogenase, beta subunit C-terminal domain n=1 Tax=Prevotella sp. TaxID=59823 RepID=UPI0040286932